MPIETLERSLKTVPFLQLLGVKVLEHRGSRLVLGLPYRRENASHSGAVHSACMFALGELAGAVAVGTHPTLSSHPHVLKCTKVKYARQTMRDITATTEIPGSMSEGIVDAVAMHGEAEMELTVRVTDEDGHEVALLQSLYSFSG